MNDDRYSLAAAQGLDAQDPSWREHFWVPPTASGDECIYLCGNSLGLQPKRTRQLVSEELDDWARFGVEGHFQSRRPWYSYHEQVSEPLARLVGAKGHEVVAMNGLTTNLHLLMTSFYRPTPERYRIVIEAGAFPSDRYAVASQARFHGFDADDAVVELAPKAGQTTLLTEDVEAWLAEHGHSVALVMIAGVQYYTGQWHDIRRITAAGHAAGALVGWDLAHAAGNVPLNLHDDGVDFAAFCSYKYLNSGPGSVSGAFVHERWSQRSDIPRFEGWWGTEPETRFEMAPKFSPQRGAGAWQLSNAPVFSIAPLIASLELFDEIGMSALRVRSLRLTDYFLELLDRFGAGTFEVITPRHAAARGCQLSLRVPGRARELHSALADAGVVCDFRVPDVIRLAPVPLYNTYEDMWRFADVFRRVIGTS
ncbi:MAG TPA: kynureninase [Myxococcales bacterium]|nr:kynureninase [Myxococcales bacterium]HAN30099.1 kynureninase [Myxococcales bacterium]